MSNRAMKIAVALSIVLTPPAASFARGGGGHGGGHGGFAPLGGFARLGGFGRLAGSAGTANVPISGVPRGPGNVGGLNNATVDPSGHNVSRIASPLLPHLAVPTQPGGTRNPAAPLSMNLNQRALPEALGGGGRQPRADQVPSERSLIDPKGAYDRQLNRENAAVDGTLNICRGC
jgi:hypothetical protein